MRSVSSHLAPQQVSHPTPHTEEWFAIMEQWDPPQAMMTRQAIAPAGSPDVCSTCGDDPANDYYLPASYRFAGGGTESLPKLYRDRSRKEEF